MSTTAYPSCLSNSAAGSLSPVARLVSKAKLAILSFVQAYEAAGKARQGLSELRTMSDRELRDIGLTRAEVDVMRVSI
jgi:uncharacterized protein YjiS (DUF1127 family)